MLWKPFVESEGLGGGCSRSAARELRGFGSVGAAGTGGCPGMRSMCVSFLQRAGQGQMQCGLLNLLQRGEIQLFQLIKQTSPCFLSTLVDGSVIN